MIGEQSFTPEKKEKPPFLYHASSNRDIERFEPRDISTRDPAEGPVVFATPDVALATAFMVSADDRWTQIGRTSGVPFIVIKDKERFLANDKGGAIYKLSSESFSCDPSKGMKESEWVSKEPVTPVAKKDCPSALDAMVEAGVKVFFVDDETFGKVKGIKYSADPDRDLVKILSSLESENEKRWKKE